MTHDVLSTAGLADRPLRLSAIETALGRLLLVEESAGALLAVEFADHEPRLRRLLARYWQADLPSLVCAAPDRVAAAFGRYFAGEVTALHALPIAVAGTQFQRRAWQSLRAIPPGETRTYAQQAASLDAPRAVRAVGSANGANPLGLVVPCHRVIASGGGLGGYAGGTDRKAWLLAHEAAHARTLPGAKGGLG